MPWDVPEPLSSFVGRDDDVAGIAELLDEERLVTVSGPGGVGKTRLVLEVARGRAGHRPEQSWLVELAPLHRPDGVWMVELAAVRDPELVPHAVLAELMGPAPGSVRSARDLIGYLRNRRVLLVLDNCEHLVDACANLVARLLRSCPRLRVLATSRQPLGITGEQVWWLEGLAVSQGPDGASAINDPAVRLFVDRVRGRDRSFAAEGTTLDAAAEICRRLDGIPLAIELAAARVGVLSPEEVLARLGDCAELLVGGSADADARHHTLRATFDWSYDLLDAAEAALLRRLSVFAGGFTLDAAEQVVAGDDLAVTEVLDGLGALVTKSLVTAERSAGRTRYRMLQTTHHYAWVKLDEAGEAESVRRRHAAWFLARAVGADQARERNGADEWPAWLEEDHDNLRGALAWARDTCDGRFGLRMGIALTGFWQTRGHLREGVEWLQWALAAADETASSERAQATRALGRLLHMLGDHQAGLALIDRSVALFSEIGEMHEASGCVCHDVVQMCRNPLHAQPALEQRVAQLRGGDDANRLAHALANLGHARFLRADADGARRCFAEVLEAEAINSDAREQALFGLVRVAILTGHYDEAAEPLAEVYALARRVGDPGSRSAALSLEADMNRLRGDTDRARALLGRAMELAHVGGEAVGVGRCELFLAAVENFDGDFEAAAVLYGRALRRVEAGAVLAYHQVRCILGLAEVAAAVGDAAAAASFLGEAHDTADSNGDVQGAARALAGRADLALAHNDMGGAAHLRHQALEREAAIGDLAGVTRSLEALAVLAAREKNPKKAARLFGAGAALRERFGFARPLRAQAGYDAEVGTARPLTEPALWQQAWGEGFDLSVDQAVAYARKGRGRRGRPPSGWDSLTPAEHEVVALVVEGLSNPDVGERLFISRRTVQHHLSHVYAKLGITSRRELMGEAQRLASR